MAYGELQIGLLWAILFGSVIELVVIEIVISNQALKTILLVLGVWSIALVLGVWASFKVNPHELKDDILTIRQGALYSLAIPLDTIESIVLSNSSDQSKCAVFNGTLFLPVMNETNIELILKTPVSPSLSWGMTGEISAIKFYVNQATRTLPQLLEMSRSKA